MNFDNIIVANIGWSEFYRGGDIASAMTFVGDHGTGAEAFNFSPSHDGLFYGYIRGERLGERSDRIWTVVFVSKPSERELLRVVGWYEDAVVGAYRDRPEYAIDDDFPEIPGAGRHIYSAITGKAFVVPAEARSELILPKGHRIKSTGVYYVAGVNNFDDTQKQANARAEMAEWLRQVLPNLRSDSRVERPISIALRSVPGIEIDEGGTPNGYSPVAESDEHRALRVWAQRNPFPFTGRAGHAGHTEWPMKSGDRVDAVHENDEGLWVIEAKSRRSPDRDIERGIYQCIKYRAVAEAMQEAISKTRPVYAVLLTERDLTAELAALAQHHEIRHFQHWCLPEEIA